MAATASSRSFRRFQTPITAVRRFALLHATAESPSNPRIPYNLDDDNDPESPAPQIVEILKHEDNETWKSNSHLNQLIFASPPLSDRQFLRISRCLPSSDAALKFADHFNEFQVEPGCLSSVFQAAFEHASRERISVELIWRLAAGRSMAVYNAVEPNSRNVSVRNLLLEVLFKNKRLENARKVLDEMLEPDSEVSADDATVKVVFVWILKSLMNNFTK